MLWQEMDNEEKESLKDKYNKIHKELRTLSNTKASRERNKPYTKQEIEQYNKEKEKLQDEYNNIQIEYRCINCNNIIRLNTKQIKELLQNENKMIFCNKQCANSYKTKQYHNNQTKEEKENINKKISKTLKNKTLTEKEKENRGNNLKEYWSNLNEKEKDKKRKENAVKSKQTKLKKYNNENYNNINKIKETYKKRYTIENPQANCLHLSKETLETIRDKEKFKNYIINIPIEKRCITTISNSLGISNSYCSELLNRYNLYKDIKIHRNLSKQQMEVEEYIKSIYKGTIEINKRDIIPPYEIDIYIPDKKLAIEYNGNYYHSIETKDKKYHYNKSRMCEEKGIRLIHIFEYEWENERQNPILKNIIESALGITKRIYARKLKIEVKTSSEMRNFFNANNIQGFRGGKFSICLIDKETNEVYMSYIFGKAFFGKGKYEYEVIRGATKLGYTVVGGASKIWKYFVDNFNPKNCVYYVDYNYFNGSSLKNLPNMKYIKTQFSFKNYYVKENEVKNRNPMHNKEIKELIKDGKVYPIHNAGTKVYVWEK